MKVCEEFVSFQGEVNVGRFAYFLRLGQCNLRCKWCDSTYAYSEWVDLPVDDIVKKAMHFPCVVITGGEPLLQREEVAKLVKKLKKANPMIVIEIETNGTVRPIQMGSYHIVYNVSLKLKNSGNEYEKRIKPSTIMWFIEAGANFKFVVDNMDDVDEVNMLVQEFGISKSQVFLMPQGKSRKEQLEKMDEIIQFAKINGYNFSPRFQVLIWDTKRGV